MLSQGVILEVQHATESISECTRTVCVFEDILPKVLIHGPGEWGQALRSSTTHWILTQ